MRLGSTCTAWVGLGALLMACSSDPGREKLDYLRSPNLFRADTTVSDHPFCSEANPLGSAEACKKERKYRLTWERPEDTANFLGYRIYLDTSLQDKSWGTVKEHPELASVLVNRHPSKDSLVFVFTDAHKSLPDTLLPGQDRIVALDSNGRAELLSGNLVFALVPVYTGGGTPGRPLFAYFVTADRQPPDVFRPDFRPLPHGLLIAWERPTDRVSFFDPSMDTGIIAGYRLEVGLDGIRTPDRRKAFQPKLKYYRMGGADSTSSVTATMKLNGEGLPDRMVYVLPDGHRSAKHTHPDATDSMYLEIEGMFPQDSLNAQLSAVDSAGNSDSTSMSKVSIRTTDTTQPSTPKLKYDSLSRNGFTVVWSAARDSVPGSDGRLTVAGRPNANILEYRLTRNLVRASGENTAGLDQRDTIIQDSLLPTRPEFRIPVSFLPPGATYHFTLLAVDSSGYPSRIDSMDVTTLNVAFADSDSVLTCPPGFIPMPRGRFLLGDNGGSDDEKPAKPAAMGPYCIEPYEHRDSTGRRFVSNVTYEQAEAICEAVSPAYSTKLCSEAEWERACEGPAADASALLHGIQSEGKDPSILQSDCNQATNDSAMAINFALRNPVCLTTEGVYDMAGNLSEWVRDTYAATAYQRLAGDTLRLDHDTVFADSGDRPPHSIRGGNYLKPGRTQLTAVQSLARCSNRDFPAQVRPVYRKDCLSEGKPRLVVMYGPGLEGHRCYEVADSILNADISDLVPAPRDSSTILAFRHGEPKPVPITFSPDSVFRGRKPLSASFTTKALAAVKFERLMPISTKDSVYEDTLDAAEFLDTTQAGMAKILQREASNPAWTAHKEDGKFAIKYLYAFTQLGTKPALPYYSSRAIGFRCCSLAIKAAAPADSIAKNP